jgi:hypothetical protein
VETWGRGIATAAVDQIVGLAGLTELAPSIAATVGPANRASLRVLEKTDFGTGTAALPATLDVITDGGARGER